MAAEELIAADETNTGDSKMEIKRIDSQPTSKGPAEWFTGSVRIDPLFEAPNRHVCVARA